MIEVFTEELDIDIASAGSTTLKHDDLRRGIESDECYFIGREEAVRGKQQISLPDDPAPDLVVEVDISGSSIDNRDIWAALGVSEVWRFDGRSLHVFRLREGGAYVPSDRSTALPGLTPQVVRQFLDQRRSVSETHLIRSFRAWVRDVSRKS